MIAPRLILHIFPKAKAAYESVVVIARAAARRQLFQFVDVAATKDYVVGLESGDQTFYDIRDMAAPFVNAVFLESSKADVIFKSTFLVRQMSEFHRLDDAIDNHRGAETGSETEEEHLAASVTSQRLHRRVVHNFDRSPERGFEIETPPTLSEVPRLGDRPVAKDRSRVADRDNVIRPILDQFSDLGDHPFWSQVFPGNECSWFDLAGGQELDVSSADINHQDFDFRFWFYKQPAILTPPAPTAIYKAATFFTKFLVEYFSGVRSGTRRMKQRVCKCCGKKISVRPVVQPFAHHLCQECASPEELTKGSQHDDKKEKGSKIIVLDRFR